MSLINQMLQDLDARRAAHGVGTSLPNDVRPLPKAPPSRLPIVLGGVLLIMLVVVAVAYVLNQKEFGAANSLAAAPVVKASPAILPDAPQPIPLPEPDKIAQTEVVSTAAVPETPLISPAIEPPAPAGSALTGLDGLDGSLRMADFLKLPVEKKSGVKSAVTTQSEKKPVEERSKSVSAEPKSDLPVDVMPQGDKKSVKPPMIERTDVAGTPRERAEIEYRKAIAAVNQGRVTEALDGLHAALRLDALHAASRQLLVSLLLEAKRPDEAIRVLQDGVQDQPAQLGWAMSLARLQVDHGDLAGAWQSLEYSLPAAANNADYQGFAAHVLQRLGRFKEAAEHYQQAARLSPADGRWWLGLGLCMEGEGRNAEAREAFLRARQSGTLSPELAAMIEQKLR